MSSKAVLLLASLLFLQLAFLTSRADAGCWFWQQCMGAGDAGEADSASPVDTNEPPPTLPLRKPSVPSKLDRGLISGRTEGSEMSATPSHPAAEAPSRGEKANGEATRAGTFSSFTAEPGAKSAYEPASTQPDAAPAEPIIDLSGPATTGNLSDPSVLLDQGTQLAPEGDGGNEISATTTQPAADASSPGENEEEPVGATASSAPTETSAAQSDYEAALQPAPVPIIPEPIIKEPSDELSNPATAANLSPANPPPEELSAPAASGASESATAPSSLPGISYTTITIE